MAVRFLSQLEFRLEVVLMPRWILISTSFAFCAMPRQGEGGC